MKQSKLFIGIMVAVAGLAGIVTLSYLQSTNHYLADAGSAGAQVAGASTARQTVTMFMNDGQQMKTYRQVMTKITNMTGLDLLRQAAAAAEWDLKTSTSSMGVLVESINNVANGTDGKYWIYYVNNQMGSVGIDQYQVQPGDVLEMNFEKSAF
jgi:hypothetical protein